jgi:hypothetical protein
MTLLQVRDFPTELYDSISRVACSENRSIPQQTIVLLKTALKLTQERKTLRKAVLQEINKLNIKNTNKFPPPEEMTREDRDE